MDEIWDKHLVEIYHNPHWSTAGCFDNEVEAERYYEDLLEKHSEWTIRRIVLKDYSEVR